MEVIHFIESNMTYYLEKTELPISKALGAGPHVVCLFPWNANLKSSCYTAGRKGGSDDRFFFVLRGNETKKKGIL